MDLVTDEMCEALRRLQAVKSFDYDAAYGAVYAGINALDPRTSGPAAEMTYGRNLALRAFHERQVTTLALRR